LILFFLYLGYIALADGFERPERGSKPASLLLIVGVINLPIIKFSVDWWNTLHQGSSVLRFGGPSIDPAMLWPLLVMALAMLGWFISVSILRMNTLLAQRRLSALEVRRHHIHRSDA
jgi:heme exporter protein C